jgi:hypothetical protein
MLQKDLRLAVAILDEKRDRDVYIIIARLDDCELPLSFENVPPVDLYETNGWQRLMFALDLRAARTYDLEALSEAAAPSHQRSAQLSAFVAMPFSKEFEDIYYYGIQRAADASGFMCDRVDQVSFIGDELESIKRRIRSSAVVVADLSGANPNVYLELGFAWGASIPTVLIVQDVRDLHFDVRGQRYLEYTSIRVLEERLTAELTSLKRQNAI